MKSGAVGSYKKGVTLGTKTCYDTAVYINVWTYSALFLGKSEEAVVIRSYNNTLPRYGDITQRGADI